MTGADVPAGWRDGVLHAIKRLERLAGALGDTSWGRAYEDAAAALREELKIAEENAA